MALYFFDSSALVKRYVHEQVSTWVRETTATASEHLLHLSLLACGSRKPVPIEISDISSSHRHP
jgi:predicted nucleic acid-binding protein